MSERGRKENQTDEERGRGGGGERGRPGRRTLAEWVSLGISAALIAGLGVFLVYEIMKGDGAYNVARAVAQTDQVQQVEGLFILPVEVENRGERTLRDVAVELTYTLPGKEQPETAEAKIDYLGEGVKQKLYFYLEHDPRQMPVSARALHYQLD